MQKHEIIKTIKSIYPEDQLLEISIELNQFNEQPDEITIIFNPEFNPLSLLGHLLDKLEDLIIEDQYGDLTGFQLNYTSSHEINPKDPNSELTCKLNLLPEIDS